MSFDYFRRHCLIITGSLLTFLGCSPKEHDAVVATVAGSPITLSQYESQYLRNAPSRDSAASMSMTERKHFLDLMVDYRLKLEDAKHDNLENQPSVRNEIRQYKGSLAQSYITDREIIQPALRKLYQRKTEELRGQHILLTLAKGASPQDSAAAYKKAGEILNSLKQGTPFDVLAKQYSIDPSAKDNGGDLYYFTGGMMVAPFEDAMFSLQPGQTSVVRTDFGLHVIQLLERKPSSGEIHCSHIMIRFPSMQPTPADTLKAYEKVSAIQDSLKKGIEFADLARRNSTDPGSAPQGGDLGWFARRRWVQSFEEQAFKLKPGEVSGIVRTPYGYHIIMCAGHRPMKTFDEMKQELSQSYQQTRAQSDYDEYLTHLKKSVGLVTNERPVEEFLATCDSTKTTRDAQWDSTLTPTLGRSVIYSAKGVSMTLDSVVSTMKARPDFPVALLRPANFKTPLGKVEEQFVWTVASDSFSTLYPDFGSILADYKDGVLLYQMEQDHVWNKVAVGDSVLQLFFEKNKTKFVWPIRLDISEVRMATTGMAEKVSAKIKTGMSFEQIVDQDSVRMARPTHWTLQFSGNSAAMTAAMKKTLAATATELMAEPELNLEVVAHPDTGKKADVTTVQKRLTAIKVFLGTALKVDTGHVRTIRRTLNPVDDKKVSARERQTLLRQVEISLATKQPLIMAKPVSSLLTVQSEDRATRADSLQVGGYSSGFPYKGFFLIVRLNQRVPSQPKTYGEAQAEVSGMYQDTESERLKTQWMKDLRSKYPVEEHPEVLRSAFAPPAR